MILEIGFNIGWSAKIWLSLTDAKIVSVDISKRKDTLIAVKKMKEMYPDRFHFLNVDSKSVLPDLTKMDCRFDLVFIDGDHTFESIDNDIQVALELKAPYIFFDDWLPRYGPGTAPAVNKHNLEIVEEMGNMLLAKGLAGQS